MKRMQIAMLQEQLRDINALLDTYICPISYELMKDPVIAGDGQTYERDKIVQWLSQHDDSPLTRQPMAKTLIPNVKAKQTIVELRENKANIETRIHNLQ